MRKPGSRKNDWFVTAFGWLYPLIYSHRDDRSATAEIRNLVEVLGMTGQKARILDVCCGGGRHTAELARLGFEVTAVDLSSVLLEKAAERAELSGRLVQTDIRALGVAGGFDWVTNLFTSFGYFTDEAENALALQEMVRVLKPGGRIVMDHINRPVLEANLVKEDSLTREDMTIHQRRRIENDRIIKEIRVERADGESHAWCENVRLYRRGEMEELFQAQGLRDIAFFGTFDGKPLAEDSPRMIVTALRDGG